MSDLIQELELQEAKQEEAWKELQKQYEEIKSKRLGKAWGSCSLKYSNLNQYKNNSYIQVMYVSDVYIGSSIDRRRKITTLEEFIQDSLDSKVYVVGEEMYINKYEAGNVSIRKSNFCNSNNNYEISFDLCNREIDLNTYQNLKNLIAGSVDNIFTLSYKNPIHIDNAENIDSVSILKDKGCKVIEITDDEFLILACESNPFIYDRNLLVTDLSREIIKDSLRKFMREDYEDKDYYMFGERIKRSGIYERKVKILNNLLQRCI